MGVNFTPKQKEYKEYKNFGTFKMFVIENFPFINEDFDAMTYYQMLCKVVGYLKDVVENNLAIQENQELVLNAYNQLQKFVNDYFDNLDVQDEINNKLDEMAESGVLQEIITAYLNTRAIFGFDNVESMKNAENFTDGSYARTLGYYAVNDGGNGLYKIRSKKETDVVDNGAIHLLNNGLVAELIADSSVRPEQFGAKGDGTSDDTIAVQNAVNFSKVVVFTKRYLLSDSIKLGSKYRELIGKGKPTIIGNGQWVFEWDGVGEEISSPRFENLNIRCNSGIRLNPVYDPVASIRYCLYGSIRDCNIQAITNQAGIGISMNKALDFIITGCQISNFGININMNGSDINTIEHNRLVGGNPSIKSTQDGTYGSQNLIRHNDILGNADKYPHTFIETSERIIHISDNYFESTGTLTDKIIEISSSICYQATIENNRCESQHPNWIFAYFTENASITFLNINGNGRENKRFHKLIHFEKLNVLEIGDTIEFAPIIHAEGNGNQKGIPYQSFDNTDPLKLDMSAGSGCQSSSIRGTYLTNRFGSIKSGMYEILAGGQLGLATLKSVSENSIYQATKLLENTDYLIDGYVTYNHFIYKVIKSGNSGMLTEKPIGYIGEVFESGTVILECVDFAITGDVTIHVKGKSIGAYSLSTNLVDLSKINRTKNISGEVAEDFEFTFNSNETADPIITLGSLLFVNNGTTPVYIKSVIVTPRVAE